MIDAMKQALEALDLSQSLLERSQHHAQILGAYTALRQAIEQAEKQEPIGYLCENAVGHKYFRWKKLTSAYNPVALYTAPPQAEKPPHTDHPMRHWDRTCPACVAETEQETFGWVKGYPKSFYAEEWFIAIKANGDRVVLKALPENYSHDFTTADGTYMKKENVKFWMQLPDSQYLPPKREIEQEPVPTWYSLSPHGDGYAIYSGRDWFHHGYNIGYLTEVTPDTVKMLESALNAAPPKREWVGLTDEEINEISERKLFGKKSVNWLVRAIEAKLRERNN